MAVRCYSPTPSVLVRISLTESSSRVVPVTETALLLGGGRSRWRPVHQRGAQGPSVQEGPAVRADKVRMRGGDWGGCKLAAKLAATWPAFKWHICSTSRHARGAGRLGRRHGGPGDAGGAAARVPADRRGQRAHGAVPGAERARAHARDAGRAAPLAPPPAADLACRGRQEDCMRGIVPQSGCADRRAGAPRPLTGRVAC
jgi:hypothetical protein